MCDIERMIADYHIQNGLKKKTVAARMGINESTYKRKTRPHDDYEITVREIIPFIRAHDNDYSLIDLIEEHLGRVAYKLPQQKEKLETSDIVKIIKDFSDSIKLMVGIIEDNKIDKKEDRLLGVKLIHMNQQINKLQAKRINKYL